MTKRMLCQTSRITLGAPFGEASVSVVELNAKQNIEIPPAGRNDSYRMLKGEVLTLT